MNKTFKVIKILLPFSLLILFSCSDDGSSSGDENSNREGCTDIYACNYDENANVSDDSCLQLDCNGECGGENVSSVQNGCDLPENTFYLLGESMIYNSNVKIAGYQFEIETSYDIDASGGDTEEYGLSISTTTGDNNPKVVLAFDFGASFIPPGCGLLVNISLSGSYDSVGGIVVSDENGEEIDFEYYDCSN